MIPISKFRALTPLQFLDEVPSEGEAPPDDILEIEAANTVFASRFSSGELLYIQLFCASGSKTLHRNICSHLDFPLIPGDYLTDISLLKSSFEFISTQETGSGQQLTVANSEFVIRVLINLDFHIEVIEIEDRYLFPA